MPVGLISSPCSWAPQVPDQIVNSEAAAVDWDRDEEAQWTGEPEEAPPS